MRRGNLIVPVVPDQFVHRLVYRAGDMPAPLAVGEDRILAPCPFRNLGTVSAELSDALSERVEGVLKGGRMAIQISFMPFLHLISVHAVPIIALGQHGLAVFDDVVAELRPFVEPVIPAGLRRPIAPGEHGLLFLRSHAQPFQIPVCRDKIVAFVG